MRSFINALFFYLIASEASAATITKFAIQGTNCDTTACQTAANAGAAVTAAKITACLANAPSGCRYTTAYTASGTLSVCSSSAVSWLEKGAIYGTQLALLRPAISGTVTAASGTITFTSTLSPSGAAPDTCALLYTPTKLTNPTTCAGVANVEDQNKITQVKYSGHKATVTLSPQILTNMLNSDIQFQASPAATCGTNWVVAANNVAYTLTHTISTHHSSALPMVQGLMAGLLALLATTFHM